MPAAFDLSGAAQAAPLCFAVPYFEQFAAVVVCGVQREPQGPMPRSSVGP